MKNAVTFCKSHFTEMLFVLVSVLTIAYAMYSALCLDGLNATSGIIISSVAQLVLGSIIRKHITGDSVFKMPITTGVLYFSAFMLSVLCCSLISLNSNGLLGLAVSVVIMKLTASYYFSSQKKLYESEKPSLS